MEKMKSILNNAAQCLKNEKGVTTMEYALVGSLISIAAIAVMTPLGVAIAGAFTTILNALP